MQSRPQSNSNYGGARRVPSGAHKTLSETAKKQETGEGEVSPLVLLSRRIRSEQGIEGLKAFLGAMRPFAAPYELKNIALSFGLDPESITRFDRPEPARTAGQGTQDAGMMNMLNMMSALGGANGASGAKNRNPMGDMGAVMQLARLMPLMQSMKQGGGDISQLFKMMQG
ncbi:MAG: hypothetical protein IKS90_00530 [Clostridia bacterium]|nr:hypothetical protein [Clostridia bacterium]